MDARVGRTPAVSIDRPADRFVSVVRLSGELDLRIHNELRELLWREADSGRDLIFDLTDVDFLDSTTLGVFVGTLKRARLHNRRRKPNVVVVTADAHAERVLSITRLDRLFTVVSTLEDAESLI